MNPNTKLKTEATTAENIKKDNGNSQNLRNEASASRSDCVSPDHLFLLDHPGIRSDIKSIPSFPGVHKRGSAVPTRASYACIYSTFPSVGAAGPGLWAWPDWAKPCALLLVSPPDPGRVKVLAWANERMQQGGNAVELGAGGGKGGADGVTECLGTCHFVSALASTSGLHSLPPPAWSG